MTSMIPSIRSFGKIWRWDSGHIPDLLSGEIEVTEKIDGSQFAFGVSDDGSVVMRSKGEVISPGAEQGLFIPAVAWVLDNEDAIRRLGHGTFVYGETLCNPQHNILTYNRVPRNNIIVFGVLHGSEYTAHYAEIEDVASSLGLETVPLLWSGASAPIDDLEQLLGRDSILGGTSVEGIVIKNYSRPIALGEKVIPSMGKLVRKDFQEVHKTDWKRLHTTTGRVDALVESFHSEARWEKAVQRLREAGQLENIPRDIGKLLPAIEADFFEEEAENVKELLYTIYAGRIAKRLKAGFPEWYKARLEETATP